MDNPSFKYFCWRCHLFKALNSPVKCFEKLIRNFEFPDGFEREKTSLEIHPAPFCPPAFTRFYFKHLILYNNRIIYPPNKIIDFASSFEGTNSHKFISRCIYGSSSEKIVDCHNKSRKKISLHSEPGEWRKMS